MAQKEVVSGAIGALTDAISFVSYSMTFLVVADIGAHFTGSDSLSHGAETLQDVFSPESISSQLNPVTLINNFKDIHSGHMLQESIDELITVSKEVGIHHTLMEGQEGVIEDGEHSAKQILTQMLFAETHDDKDSQLSS